MPRQRLGPWGKLYASLEEDLAHYTDAQFRAFISILCRAIRNRGELPKQRALEAIYGSDVVAFLLDEEQLSRTPEGRMAIDGFDVYQAPVDRTNADRQQRFRERNRNGSRAVDNALAPVSNGVTVTEVPTSTSTSRESEEEDGAVAVNGGVDALDRFHDLTQIRPWGRPSGRWLNELQDQHGVVNVLAALEVEAKTAIDGTLIKRTAVRLERQADRVAQAKARERPAPPPDDRPAPEPTPENIEAGRKAHEALRARWGKPNGHERGGSARLGDLLPSAPDGSATSPVSGEGRRADPPADAVESSFGSFAPASGPPPARGRPTA